LYNRGTAESLEGRAGDQRLWVLTWSGILSAVVHFSAS
jgi:hypothetical protein